jgi:hypothetical protein
MTFDNLLMCWEQFSETNANQVLMEQPEEVSDSESVDTNVKAACEWLDIDDDDTSKDILEIVKSCLKGMKRLKTGCSIR